MWVSPVWLISIVLIRSPECPPPCAWNIFPDLHPDHYCQAQRVERDSKGAALGVLGAAPGRLGVGDISRGSAQGLHRAME